MAEKPYCEMTDDELRAAYVAWDERVDKANGWPSGYFAAKQLEAICREGNRRNLGMINRFPINLGMINRLQIKHGA